MFNFKKPKNELELFLRIGKKETPGIPDEMFMRCPDCSAAITLDELNDNMKVCPRCSYHFQMNARERIAMCCDSGSFTEHDAELETDNILKFPEYEDKLARARRHSSEREAVVTGTGSIGGVDAAFFVMEGSFMMGSMGRVVGEKITRLFEYATENSLPVVGFTISGGARMQEGILSLMQMAKCSGAVKRHSDCGLLYITVITNPTTGGVTASFAMDGDIIISEPGALICFAGPRVIEQTTRQKLPPGFQKAEFLLAHGFLDEIVSRLDMRAHLEQLLLFHRRATDQTPVPAQDSKSEEAS